MRRIFVVIILSFFACAEVEDVVVVGNTIPTDHTIENITIETYINKLYISIIGREPTIAEFNDDFDLLRSANLSQISREIVISRILEKEEYIFNLFRLESGNILNGVDTGMINNRVQILESLMQTTTGLDSIYILNAYNRSLKLQAVMPGLIDGTLSVIEMHIRMVDNYFYDQINMGTENFVVSCFQNFMGRYPTDSEVENGTIMVNGENSTLFLQFGSGKDEFMNIFFYTDEYYTGQTSILFNRYLFRNPTSEESVDYSLDYISSGDYKEFQMRILSTNEFIGL